MPKLKPGTLMPTDEEDLIITKAAHADPDATPLSDDEWAEQDFQAMSVDQAMRDLENEPEIYTEADLKERWQ